MTYLYSNNWQTIKKPTKTNDYRGEMSTNKFALTNINWEITVMSESDTENLRREKFYKKQEIAISKRETQIKTKYWLKSISIKTSSNNLVFWKWDTLICDIIDSWWEKFTIKLSINSLSSPVNTDIKQHIEINRRSIQKFNNIKNIVSTKWLSISTQDRSKLIVKNANWFQWSISLHETDYAHQSTYNLKMQKQWEQNILYNLDGNKNKITKITEEALRKKDTQNYKKKYNEGLKENIQCKEFIKIFNDHWTWNIEATQSSGEHIWTDYNISSLWVSIKLNFLNRTAKEWTIDYNTPSINWVNIESVFWNFSIWENIDIQSIQKTIKTHLQLFHTKRKFWILSKKMWYKTYYKLNWNNLILEKYIEWKKVWEESFEINMSHLTEKKKNYILTTLNVWVSKVINEVRKEEENFPEFIKYCKQNSPKLAIWQNTVLDLSNIEKYMSFTRWILNLQQKLKTQWKEHSRETTLKLYQQYCNEYINQKDNFDKVYYIRDKKTDRNNAFEGNQGSFDDYIDIIQKKYKWKIEYFWNYSENDKKIISWEINNVTANVIIEKLKTELETEANLKRRNPDHTPKKILFDLWLHGGTNGWASFTNWWDFTKQNFQEIFNLTQKYSFLTVKLSSCNSWHKTESEIKGNVIMSSSDQVSSNALDWSFTYWFYKNTWDLNWDSNVTIHEAVFYSAMNYTTSLVPISFVRENWESVQLCGTL